MSKPAGLLNERVSLTSHTACSLRGSHHGGSLFARSFLDEISTAWVGLALRCCHANATPIVQLCLRF